MQEYIINGLLVVVALLAVILQIIGTRPTAGMTKKVQTCALPICSTVNFAGPGRRRI